MNKEERNKIVNEVYETFKLRFERMVVEIETEIETIKKDLQQTMRAVVELEYSLTSKPKENTLEEEIVDDDNDLSFKVK